MIISSWVAWIVKMAPTLVEAAEFLLVVLIARRLLGRGRRNWRLVGKARAKDFRHVDSTSERDDTQGEPEEDGGGPGEIELAPESAERDGKDRIKFMVDALFLADSFHFVCGDGDKEVFHYVTGFPVDGTFVLTRIVPVAFSHQSAGGVRVDDGSNIRALERLDEWGLPLVAHFHSHPGNGVSGTTPSGTDRRFVERLARGGHIALGAIFSRDGFVRFYAHESVPFSIEIKGHQIGRVSDNVFQLEMENREIPVVVYPNGRSARGGCR